MESIELINSGLDAVDTIIKYLAKDAVGADFINKYVESRDIQKAATEEQTESLKKLIDSSNQMENSTKEISSSATANQDSLNAIYGTISTLKETTEKIEQDYKRYVEQFQNLILQTKQITGFISDIQKISSQTNLLSFNASIEAAHAGAAGAGFRIIANEVKKLSDNTEKSANKMQANVSQLEKSITELEEETKKNTENLKLLGNEVNKTLNNYEIVKNTNSESQRVVEDFAVYIHNNLNQIDDMISSVEKNDEVNAKTVKLFTDCASKNNMLFNDLYSFIYEIKAIFEDLKLKNNIPSELSENLDL